MSSYLLDGKYVSLPLTSRQVKLGRNVFSNQIAPTDPIFRTNLKLVSLEVGYAYSVLGTDSSTLGSGNFAASPVYIADVEAFTESDQISVSYLKYGFQFNTVAFVLTPLETLLFMSHVANTNITLNDTDTIALTGIVVDKSLKTITISESHSINNVYDYMQMFQSLTINIDLLVEGEILSTVQGVNFTLKSDWSIIFNVNNLGIWNLTSNNITLTAPLTLTTFNLTGTLFFDVDGTYNIVSSLIDNVDTVDKIETVIVEPTGTTLITNNLDNTNITVNTAPKTLTITGVIDGTEIRIYDENNDMFELGGIESTVGDFVLSFTGSKTVTIVIMSIEYSYIRYENIILNTDNSMQITQTKDITYKNN
jgi:hypothetical protein